MLGNKFNKPTPSKQAINNIYNRKMSQKKQKSDALMQDKATK